MLSLRERSDLPVAFLNSPVQHGAAVVVVVVVVVVVAAVVAEPEEDPQRNLGEGLPPLNARLKTEVSSCWSSELLLHCTQDLVLIKDEEAEVSAVSADLVSAGGIYLNPRIHPVIGWNTKVTYRRNVNMTKMLLDD